MMSLNEPCYETCGAYILGCEGLELTADERHFFASAKPLGFILFARNVSTPEQVLALTSDLRACVGWNAPILIDQEGGRVQRMRAPHWREFLPPLDQCERASDPERAMWLRGRLIAQDLYSCGVDVNCAPTLDIASDETHPFLRNRCYGSDAQTIARFGRAFADGMAAGGVLSVMKHIPGHGRTKVDSHKNLPRTTVPRAALTDDFAPFKALNDLPMGMSAHIVMEAIDPDRPATQSPACIEVIRTEIGFDGLLMTDDLSMEALNGTVLERGQAALAAGCDVVLHCNGNLAEMRSLTALGLLSEAAAARAKAALTTRQTAQVLDIAAADAELESLLA
jgi:beta-N-acetylhexosaminidase